MIVRLIEGILRTVHNTCVSSGVLSIYLEIYRTVNTISGSRSIFNSIKPVKSRSFRSQVINTPKITYETKPARAMESMPSLQGPGNNRILYGRGKPEGFDA